MCDEIVLRIRNWKATDGTSKCQRDLLNDQRNLFRETLSIAEPPLIRFGASSHQDRDVANHSP